MTAAHFIHAFMHCTTEELSINVDTFKVQKLKTNLCTPSTDI